MLGTLGMRKVLTEFEQLVNAVVQQISVDGVPFAEMLSSHSVEVVTGQTLKLLASQVGHGVADVGRLARHEEDDVQHVGVAPEARMQPLPVLLPAAVI